MADISKITLPDGSEYDLKDSVARGKFPVSIANGGTGKTTAIDGFWALEDRGYSSNANDALSVGIYNTNTSTANLPALAYSQNNGCGILIVYVSTLGTHNNSNNWVWQIWFNTTTNDLYRRKKVNTSPWGSWTADADSVAKLKTARTFNVGGQAKGTAQSFDGSQNVTIPITEFNTQGLARPTGLRGLNDVTLQSLVNTTRANRLAFLPADQIIIEQTVDGGNTWTSANVADSVKVGIFSETRANVSLPKIDGKMSPLCGLRITFTAMKYNVPSGTAETAKYNYWNSNYVLSTERYCQLKEMYFWLTAVNNSIGVVAQRANGATPDTWQTIFNDSSYYMVGWSGCDYIRFSQSAFGGGTNQTSQPWNYRLIFMTKGVNGTDTMGTGYETSSQSIMEIRAYGDTWWTKANEYMANDKMYTHDVDKNVTFPAKVTAASFSGALTGNADTATKATQDESGNNIKASYASSMSISDHTITLKNKNGASLGTVTVPDNNTTYTANTSKLVTTSVPNITSVGSAPTLGTAITADDITAWTTNTPTSFVVTDQKLSITSGTAASLSYSARTIPNVTSVGSAPTLGTAITVATGSLNQNGSGASVATGITPS